MRRRRALALTGTAASLALAGCSVLGGDSSDDSDSTADDSGSTPDDTAGTSGRNGDVDFRGSLVGLTASNINRADEAGIEEQIATELGLAPTDVQVSPISDTVEVFAADISADELADALSAVGVSTSETEIRSGVTAVTYQQTANILDRRFERAGIDGSVSIDGAGADAVVLIDVPDGKRKWARELVENRGRVQIVAGYPDPNSEEEPVMEEVLTADDIVSVDGATQTRDGGAVVVTLSEDAAESFAQTMIDAGFTREGRGNCDFDPETDDPDPNNHCLYTVINGEIVTGLAMGGLAEVIDPGRSGDYSEFVANPAFQISTADFQEAERLSLLLQSGSLPTEVRLEAVSE